VSEPERPAPKPEDEIVAEPELLRLAGIDMARFLALSDFEQRLVLKMAAQLVDAQRRAETPEDDAQGGATG